MLSIRQTPRNNETYRLKEEGNLGCDTDELLTPELVLDIAKQLNERNQRSPRVRAVDEEALKEDLGHHLSEAIHIDFKEEVEHQRAEPMGVSIGVAEMEHHRAQEVVLAWRMMRSNG